VLSQHRDFQRLVPTDYAWQPPFAVALHDASREMPFHEIHRRFSENLFFHDWYVDASCRRLLAHRLTREEFAKAEPERRADLAWQIVQERLDFVGITERMQETVSLLAERLHRPPPNKIERLNVTASETVTEDCSLDRQAAEEITQGDRILYERAAAQFEDMIVSRPEPYCDSAFERHHAEYAVFELTPYFQGAEATFDMNMPLIGEGFHGRDSRGNGDCCRWMGTDSHATLYIRNIAPLGLRSDLYSAGKQFRLKFHVRGWVSKELRHTLRIKVDGRDVTWHSELSPGCEEALVVTVEPARAFFKVEFFAESTLTDEEAGRPSEDLRPKVFNLWRYSVEDVTGLNDSAEVTDGNVGETDSVEPDDPREVQVNGIEPLAAPAIQNATWSWVRIRTPSSPARRFGPPFWAGLSTSCVTSNCSFKSCPRR